MRLIPRKINKLKRNKVIYSNYNDIYIANKIMKITNIDINKIGPYRGGEESLFTHGIGRAIKNVVNDFSSARKKTAPEAKAMSARCKYLSTIEETIKRMKGRMIRGWTLNIDNLVSCDPRITFMSGRQIVVVTMSNAMLYKAGQQRPNFLTYSAACWSSSLSGVIILGISSEMESSHEIIGDVRIGMAAIFKSSEANHGLQWRWFCMGRTLEIDRVKLAACGFGADPTAAMEAAMRMSAKFMRQKLRSN